MEEDDKASSVSSNSSSKDSSAAASLSEDEIEKLVELFKKDINRNYGIFISLNSRKSRKSRSKTQTITNEKCHIEQQHNINLTVNSTNINNKQHGIPFDIPRYTNQYFGRKPEVEKLEKTIQNNKLAIVTGIDGIGKTEFAKYYIEQFYEKYEMIEWINGSTKDTFNQSLTYITDKYQINNNNKDFVQYFQKRNALFVIDNAYDKIQFRHCFPRSADVSIIITTEYLDVNYKKSLFKLFPISDEEAIDLLESIFEEELNDINWIKLVQYFDNIPLALQLIGACLHKEMLQNKLLTVDHYYNDIQKYLVQENEQSEQYKKIYISLKLSIETLTKFELESSIALEILNICVYLDDDHISTQLLVEYQSLQKPKLDEILNTLKKYKLVTIEIKQHHNEIHIHNCIRRMLFLHQQQNNTSHTYFKMVLSLVPSMGIYNIKYLLKFSENFINILVEYIINNNLFNLLDVIIQNGYDKILLYILKSIPEPETVIKEYDLMRKAVEYEQIAMVKVLIEFKADVNVLTDKRRSLLHFASKKCSLAIITCLLQAGVCPNIEDYKMNTALHTIVSVGYTHTQNEDQVIQCTRVLLKNGANINAVNIEGDTALNIALKNKAFKLALFLLNQIAIQIIETTIQIIFDLDISDNKEERLAFKIIRTLLLKGANKNAEDNEKRSLLIWAIDNKCQKIIEFLLRDCSLNVNHQDIYGQTALHKLLNQGISNKRQAQAIVAIVRLLLDYKIRTDIEDYEGYTAMDLSSNHGNVKLCLFIQFLNYELTDKKKKDYYLPDKQNSKPEKRSTSVRPPFWDSYKDPNIAKCTIRPLDYASRFHLTQAVSWTPSVPPSYVSGSSYCNNLLN